MDDTLDMTPQLMGLALLLPFTLGAIAIAGMRGCLSPAKLNQGPSRDIILTGNDLFLTAMLKLLGLVAGSAMMASFLRNPSVNQIALATLLTQLVTSILPVAYILGCVYGREKAGPLFGLGPWNRTHLRMGVLALLLALPVVMTLSMLGSLVMMLFGHAPPASGHDLLLLLAEPEAKYAGLLISLSAVLIAPVAEEIIYRGLLQTWLLRHVGQSRRWLVITASSALFAAVHLGSVPLIMLPALFALGLILGWLYETTGSLTPSIILHALFNGVNLLLASVVLN